MTVTGYNIIPSETMQLELMSWRDKAEVLCHQLTLDNVFFMEVLTNPVVGASCPSSGDALGQHGEGRQALSSQTVLWKWLYWRRIWCLTTE